jgi:hypothetical protein
MMEGGYSTIEPLPRGYEPACQLITIILRRAANFITPSCDLAARAKLISLHTAIKPNLNAPTAKLANRASFVPQATHVISETLAAGTRRSSFARGRRFAPLRHVWRVVSLGSCGDGARRVPTEASWASSYLIIVVIAYNVRRFD